MRTLLWISLGIAAALAACSVEDVTFVQGEEDCAAEGDEDGNGLSDCADPVCAGLRMCTPGCGNGKVEVGETCDDGNETTEACAYGQSSCMVCDATCQAVAGETSLCGDGATDAALETCDDGNAMTEACAYGEVSCTVCDATCQAIAGETSLCGDGTMDAGFEACDDGNTTTEACAYGEVSCTVCDATCQAVAGETAFCSDGTTDAGFETCDDGNATTEVCTYGQMSCTVCDAACQAVAGETAYCGDATTDAGFEACDDGNTSNTDACLNTCQAASCGDGFVRTGVEECDDGNLVDTDACLSTCEAATCGDGIVHVGVEECDDGNTSNGDGCNSNCQLPLVNASFETGDYTGWTLQEDSSNPMAGAWAIGVDGTTLMTGQMVFDFTDGVSVPTNCISPSFVLDATDGTHLAFQIQTGPENHRMSQDIVLAPGLTTLSWDMGYHNHGSFEPNQQFLAVHLRDPNTDGILTTLYKTSAGDPLTLPMTTFSRSIAAFAGMPVRIDVEMQVQQTCFDGQFDNFVLN